MLSCSRGMTSVTTGAGTSLAVAIAWTVSSDMALTSSTAASSSSRTAPTSAGSSVRAVGMTSPAMGKRASPPVTSAHSCWRSTVRSRLMPCCWALARLTLAGCSGRTT